MVKEGGRNVLQSYEGFSQAAWTSTASHPGTKVYPIGVVDIHRVKVYMCSLRSRNSLHVECL